MRMRMAEQFGYAAILIGLLASTPALATPSSGLRVQGTMTGNAGPAPDGNYAITFRLYAGQDDKVALYKEIHLGVPLLAGSFTAVIGTEDPNVPLPVELFTTNPNMWIGLQVSVEPELPRVALLNVPYAMHALIADKLAGQADGIKCTGCITLDNMAPGVLDAANINVKNGGNNATLQSLFLPLVNNVRVDGIAVGIAKIPSNLCAFDVASDGGTTCIDGAPALWTRMAANENDMKNYTTDGQLLYRKDEGSSWMRSKGVWRKLAYVAVCGDGNVEGAEECDDGANNANAPDKCRTSCKLPICGDKITDKAEACDDGNKISTDACLDCVAAKCGDGAVQAGVEECDDGANNANSPNKCKLSCKKPICGDGFTDTAEECDDGNKVDNDNCGNTCKIACKPCSNGSCIDCNFPNSTLVPGSAYVDPAPPQGWVQCAGFINTAADDVGPLASNNCLGAVQLRMRVWDTNNVLIVDVYETGLTFGNTWPATPNYLDGCNCGVPLTAVVCNPTYWPCGNLAGFYGSTNGAGGGGCAGYAKGGMTFSNGNGGQLTVAPADVGSQEIWQGPCYGNTAYTGFKAALYK